jgi:tRNA1Val (adenine37-N6)-methyltransferase
MANSYFQFKQFTIHQDHCAMKVTTDACLFGGWCVEQVREMKPGNALDIGAGTGLLSMMLAQENSFPIDALEIDADAAKQAAQNVAAAGYRNITVQEADIITAALPKYDLVISNPPFYEQELLPQSQAKQRAHHHGGLRWEELFRVISNCLSGNGTVLLLLPYKRHRDLEPLLSANGLHLRKEVTVFPTASPNATRLMIAASNTAGAVAREEITIKNGADYSERFVQLLRPYYLYL